MEGYGGLMKFSHIFNVFKIEECGENFIWYEEFVAYMYLQSKDKDIRTNNLRRTLKGYKEGLQIYQDKTAVPIKSVIRYVFQNSDTYQSCKVLSKVIELELVNDTESLPSSSLELYQLIAKSQFNSVHINNVEFKESEIKTLIPEHRPHFCAEEWQIICWFENHFSKYVEFQTLDYDNIVCLKFRKYQSLLRTKECSEKWLKASQVHIRDDIQRMKEADVLNKVELCGSERHSAFILDGDILSLMSKYCGESVQSATTIDSAKSKQNNSLDVIVELNEQVQHSYNDLAKRLFYFIQRKHSVNIDTVYFVHTSKVNVFTHRETIARFQFRDAIQTGKFTDFISIWSGDSACIPLQTEIAGNDVCDGCFKENSNPLSVENFEILKEWYLEIPAETQILLGTFVNTRCLKKSPNPQLYAKQKLEKLYRCNESLMNTLNMHFSGVFQKANADNLLIEYKSLASVFEVTSATGTTGSYKSADKKMKEKSDADLCYYNTFLKQHDLMYHSISGNKSQTSMRDCHLILMLDNLVRLTFKSDPNPREARSNQLCTLPITLQGLPLDSKITESWHGQECDGSETCFCKDPVTLSQADIETTLLRKTEDETDAVDRFHQLLLWGNVSIWKKLTQKDDVMDHLEAPRTKDTQSQHNAVPDIPPDETNYADEDSEASEDTDLLQLLEQMGDFEAEEGDNREFGEQSPYFEEEEELLLDLEKSVDQITLIDDDSINESPASVQSLMSSFGFSKFVVPPLLCRHPPPAIGRDDDIMKIREILDDIYVKMGYSVSSEKAVNKILCGADNKIGKCVLRLIEIDPKYKTFLPEFPLLHLRKSKITVLFSAYKDAGLIQLLKYMKEDDHDEWKKLISVQHIDTATRYVKRIAIALNLALLVAFARWLPSDEQEAFLSDMETSTPKEVSSNWNCVLETFVSVGSKGNATFALHMDLLKHCSHVVAIALAERLGGPEGYSLLTAVVKEDLPFLFVNNASSYAPFCTKLLYTHATAGLFHQCMKQTLFSTPFKRSTKNFACDTKRELDHIEALKGFRSGSTMESVTCRMSLLDSLNDGKSISSHFASNNKDDGDNLGWEMSQVDENHIFPTAALILKQGGFLTGECDTPMNVYTKTPILLPPSVLDASSNETGIYLLRRFLAKERMFGLTESDTPKANDLTGPKELVTRAKRSKGTTIKRTTKAKVVNVKSDRQVKEEKRQKVVAKELKRADCFSSDNNTCQALLKPDSTKPKVVKSLGMQRALTSLIKQCLNTQEENFDNYIRLNIASIPRHIQSTMKVCAVEFAGAKFKMSHAKTGQEYLDQVEFFTNLLVRNSHNAHLVICEEKYSCTPDDFKAATRQQRQGPSNAGVDHLKTSSSILSSTTFHKDALTKTEKGKRLISTYLADNILNVSLNSSCRLTVDSELHPTRESCTCVDKCICQPSFTPISRLFSDGKGAPEVTLMSHIRQRKGEAEMAVVDWIVDLQDDLQKHDSVVSFITSGDIDAVYIHLFAISRKFDRDDTGSFLKPVYVVLQKTKSKYDVYNITAILHLLERTFQDKHIGEKVAVALCLGGNDFLPKFHAISHETILNAVINKTDYRLHLLNFESQGSGIMLNSEKFKCLIKDIYCPKRHRSSNLKFEEVRVLTIWGNKPKNDEGHPTNDPRKWLPPESALDRLCTLVQLQIAYMEGVGCHEATMPLFLEANCLKKTASGEIEYDFGPECHFNNLLQLPRLLGKSVSSQKRGSDTTPQKGVRRKKMLTSTPKSRK